MRQMENSDLVRINRAWYDGLVKDEATIRRELVAAETSAREKAASYLKDRTLQKFASSRSEQIASMQSELATMSTRRQSLEAAFDAEKTRLEQFAGETADLYFAQQQYDQAAAILEKLNMRIASLRTERQRGATVQTLAKATPPASPIEEVPTKKILVASGAAFVLPFLVALAWEFFIKRVSGPSSIESRNLMPLIGEVARLPSGVFTKGKKRVFEESVDALRANLLLSSELGELRTFAVTSSMSGEGKSSLSSQLAVSVAKATGERVLLIDADLRSPDQHHLFGLEMGLGLSGVLSGRVSLDAAIDRSLGGLLHVLPAGHLTASPHRLLSPSALRDLVDQATGELGYRYVIFDTAPVLSAGETLAVAAEVDATLLCVMRDVSRVDSLERTSRRLEATGATIAGIVFNGVPSREYAYRYGDYRYGEPQRRAAEVLTASK
jgi:capsular exopolysaccharide synthesis family protein